MHSTPSRKKPPIFFVRRCGFVFGLGSGSGYDFGVVLRRQDGECDAVVANEGGEFVGVHSERTAKRAFFRRRPRGTLFHGDSSVFVGSGRCGRKPRNENCGRRRTGEQEHCRAHGWPAGLRIGVMTIRHRRAARTAAHSRAGRHRAGLQPRRQAPNRPYHALRELIHAMHPGSRVSKALVRGVRRGAARRDD